MRKSIILSALILGAVPSLYVTSASAAPRQIAVRAHGHGRKPAQAVASARSRRVTSHRIYARIQPSPDLGPLIGSIFGIASAYGYNGGADGPAEVRLSRPRAAADERPSSSDETPIADAPSVDTSGSSTVDASAAAIQAANDQAALNASMAAAEQQNEAAQASALQAELNANNN